MSPGYISFKGGKMAGSQVCKKPFIKVHKSGRTEYPDKSKVTELKRLVLLSLRERT